MVRGYVMMHFIQFFFFKELETNLRSGNLGFMQSRDGVG